MNPWISRLVGNNPSAFRGKARWSSALPSNTQICTPNILNAAPLLRFQVSTTPHLKNWSGPTRDTGRSNLRLAEAPILVPPFVRTSVSTISQLLLIDSHCGSDIYVSAADLSASTSDCPRDGNSGVSEKGYSSNVCLRSLHLLATSKSGTLWEARDQVLDRGLVSSLRVLLCCLRRSMVWACTSFLRRSISSRLPLRTSDGVTFPRALW